MKTRLYIYGIGAVLIGGMCMGTHLDAKFNVASGAWYGIIFGAITVIVGILEIKNAANTVT